MEAILKRKMSAFPGHIQAVFIHNILKLYTHILCKASTEEEEQAAAKVYRSPSIYKYNTRFYIVRIIRDCPDKVNDMILKFFFKILKS